MPMIVNYQLIFNSDTILDDCFFNSSDLCKLLYYLVQDISCNILVIINKF